MKLIIAWTCFVAAAAMPIVGSWLKQCGPSWLEPEAATASCFFMGILFMLQGIVSIMLYYDR